MTRSTLRWAQGRPEDDRGATKLRVTVRKIEPLQTNVILRLKAEESLFKSAASCGEIDPSELKYKKNRRNDPISSLPAYHDYRREIDYSFDEVVKLLYAKLYDEMAPTVCHSLNRLSPSSSISPVPVVAVGL